MCLFWVATVSYEIKREQWSKSENVEQKYLKTNQDDVDCPVYCSRCEAPGKQQNLE